MPSRFTVCVLHYGDFPQFARRVMESLSREAWMPQLDLRVGSNAVSAEVRDYLGEFGKRWTGGWTWIDSSTNRFKYPMMRELLRRQPLREYCMWFDDDSAILPSAPPNWFQRVAEKMANADMVGSLWAKKAAAKREFYEQQPWYRGKPACARVIFATGGWWTIRSEVLMRFDWPPPDMLHNGGDMALGELLRQNNLRLARFDSHLAINADDSLRCSSAKRRGISQPDYGTDKWRKLQK
jgi:hypothetical protein